MHTAETLEIRLADLTSRFARTVPDRVRVIASTLTRDRSDIPEIAPLLEQLFHTLAGTAGTFGLQALSAIAAEGEEVCAALEEGSIDPDSLTYLNFLVDQLRVLSGDCHPCLDRSRPNVNSATADEGMGDYVV